MPSEKYAHGPEILAHCHRIGRQYQLYENALFHTQVTDARWDESRGCWVVETNRNDRFTAQYLGLGTGPLHVPKLPGIPGIQEFQGHSFHTSRWDYGYTGGSYEGAVMDRLADKRVGVIGTGATAVQCVPCWHGHVSHFMSFNARHRLWMFEAIIRLTPPGSRRSPRPGGSSDGWITS